MSTIDRASIAETVIPSQLAGGAMAAIARGWRRITATTPDGSALIARLAVGVLLFPHGALHLLEPRLRHPARQGKFVVLDDQAARVGLQSIAVSAALDVDLRHDALASFPVIGPPWRALPGFSFGARLLLLLLLLRGAQPAREGPRRRSIEKGPLPFSITMAASATTSRWYS